MQELKDKLIAFKQDIVSKNNRWKELNGDLFEAKAKETRLENSIEMNSKALVVIQTLYEKLNEKGLQVVCKLMTGGLSQIFPDRNYQVCHAITMERGVNNLNFFLKEIREDGKIVTSNIRNSTGGSIRAITGLVGTLFYILKLKGKRFIAIDEGLSQVEDLVVEDLFKMIKSFCKEAGFMILLVTHDPRFLPYADRTYIVKDGRTPEIKNKVGE